MATFYSYRNESLPEIVAIAAKHFTQTPKSRQLYTDSTGCLTSAIEATNAIHSDKPTAITYRALTMTNFKLDGVDSL